MSVTNNHKFNPRYHRNGQKFNYAPQINWREITEDDKRQAQNALEALIEKSPELIQED